MLDTTTTAEGSPRIKPNDADVVCGRSTLARSHSGNRRFRALIQKAGDAYQNAKSRKAKKQITTNIIQSIFGFGGEFLKVTRESTSDDGTKHSLEVATEDFIYEKVSHALRSYRPSTITAHICCCHARNHEGEHHHDRDDHVHASHHDDYSSLDFIVDNVSWGDSDSVCVPLAVAPIRTVSYKEVIEDNINIPVSPSPTHLTPLSSDNNVQTLPAPLSSDDSAKARDIHALNDNILNEPLELDSFQWEEDPSEINLDIFEL